jgi:hypothetical protein
MFDALREEKRRNRCSDRFRFHKLFIIVIPQIDVFCILFSGYAREYSQCAILYMAKYTEELEPSVLSLKMDVI